jgi:hypothetical protein
MDKTVYVQGRLETVLDDTLMGYFSKRCVLGACVRHTMGGPLMNRRRSFILPLQLGVERRRLSVRRFVSTATTSSLRPLHHPVPCHLVTLASGRARWSAMPAQTHRPRPQSPALQALASPTPRDHTSLLPSIAQSLHLPLLYDPTTSQDPPLLRLPSPSGLAGCLLWQPAVRCARRDPSDPS